MKKLSFAVVACGLVWAGLGAGVAAGQGAPGAATAPKRPMTFADLMAMKRVSDPQISPSGKWVLFSVTDVSLEKNTKVNHLWVVPLDGSAPERQVTSNTGESFGRFSPDGKWVSFTGEGTKDDPVERITIATWDEKTGTIGVGRSLKAVSGDADGAIWSPDSRHFLFVTDVWPECSVKGPDPTHDDGTVMNGAPSVGGVSKYGDSSATPQNGSSKVGGGPFVVVGGTRDVGWWKSAQPATWAEEDACDKAKDEAADKSPVKGQVWEGLLYRHWDHYTGAKRSHVLVVDVDGSGVRDLTPANVVGDAETPTWMLGGPQEYAWAPDGKEIAYVTNLDPVPAASTNNDVFTLRLDEAGAKAVKVSTSPGSDDEPEYSPDGKWLAWRSQARGGFESDRFRLMVAARVSGSASQQVSGREWSEPKELIPKFDGWVDEFTWTEADTIVFVSGQVGLETLFRCNVRQSSWEGLMLAGRKGPMPTAEEGPVQTAAEGLAPTAGEFSEIHGISIIDPTPFRGYGIVASWTHTDAPTELEYLDYGDRRPPDGGGSGGSSSGNLLTARPLTRVNADLLQKLDLGRLQPFWFTGAEGTKVEGFILRPPGFEAGKKYPVKFLMHGGPQTAWGDAWSYRWNWELMAASGYVVIGINRRGSTGYGQKFVDEVSGDWGGRAYEDLMKGLDYAEATYPFIDKTRECALGASYGGFMADWVLTHTNRFKCIVTHDGMYDPVSAWGDTEEMWFNEWEFRRPEDFPKGWDGFTDPTHAQSARVNGAPASVEGHPAEPWRYQNLPADQDPFRKWSPMRFIENAKTPTLIIHSQKDMRLDVSQGMELFTALQRLGVPSKMLYFPDEGHWVLKPQNSEVWNAEVSDWCDRWTKTGKYAEK